MEAKITLTTNPSYDGVVAVLPLDLSAKLPSRGMVMTELALNGVVFRLPVEPNGLKSHWFRVPQAVLAKARVGVGDTVSLSVTPIKEWSEPEVPADLAKELGRDPLMLATWNDITPAARWDWVRWMVAPKQAETRARRVQSIASRMRDGKRRPCCFDRAQCTLTA